MKKKMALFPHAFTITMSDEGYNALLDRARDEMRTPAQLARVIIEKELIGGSVVSKLTMVK